MTVVLGCAGNDSTLLLPAEVASPTPSQQASDGGVQPSTEPSLTSDAGATPVDDAGAAAPPPTSDAGGELPLSGLKERPAAVAFLNLPEVADVAPQGWIAVEAFPHLTFTNAVTFTAAPRTGHIFVTEREGRVYAFANDPDVTEKTLALDLSAVNQGGGDSGLLGLAFHPEFGRTDSANGRYVYLHYAYTTTPLVGGRPPDYTPTISRLARFTVDLDTFVIDPSSELVLIDQNDEHIWHQGGALFFHPTDGFLYLSVGDEGAYRCEFDNCQQIDKDLFGGVLRIDVDMRGGDISHPIPRQPLDGVTANYYIPNDNPFVGQPGVLEEFYALGLRSPWKMTYDEQDGIGWIGEVGEVQHEELLILQRGANYQWNVLEGTVAGTRPMPAQVIGTWTPPVMEFERTESAAIVGGYVYRGSALPYLYGKYIFADFIKGSIWALTYGYEDGRVTVRDRELLVTTPFRGQSSGITAFGIDENQELYIVKFGAQGKIYRLDRTEGFSNAPARLSETGAFDDTAALKPNAALVPYSVQSALWSDGASKRRWVSTPDDAHFEFSEAGPWAPPPGTVFVKHFELPLDQAQPDVVRRLETRLLVANDSGVYGLTYKWNAEGTDADLLLESQTEEITIRDVNGQAHEIQYFYPGPGDCLVCHNEAAGKVLGVRTEQLNGDFLYPGTDISANQLLTWSEIGLLNTTLSAESVAAAPRLVPLSDDSATLAARVRSYWSSNCAMCHGVVSGIQANWDARFETPLADQGVIWGTPIGGTGLPDDFLISPGSAQDSLIYRRSSSVNSVSKMPPLGRSSVDPLYVQTLELWIQELAQLYPNAPTAQ